MKDQRDILEVLRDPGYLGQQPIFARAADEIERLKMALDVANSNTAEAFDENERLRDALKRISERQDNTSNWNEYESGYKCGTEACAFIADEALALTGEKG